jgi:hypothetical protein
MLREDSIKSYVCAHEVYPRLDECKFHYVISMMSTAFATWATPTHEQRPTPIGRREPVVKPSGIEICIS